MKSKFSIFALCLSLVLMLSAAVVAQETMTNDEVISLTKAGLSSSIIVGKIKSSATKFDLSTDSLIKLKQAGVSDDIVGAMLESKSGRLTPRRHPQVPLRPRPTATRTIRCRNTRTGSISLRKKTAFVK